MYKKIREYLTKIGAQGGAAAVGDKKRRPHEHYMRLVQIRAQRREDRKKQKKQTSNSDISGNSTSQKPL